MSSKGQTTEIKAVPVTVDFQMSPNARWHHQITLNNAGSPIQIKGVRFKTNTDISSPGQMLAPYWSKVKKESDGIFYTYTLTLDSPLNIPANQSTLLDYDFGSCLGPIQNVATPPDEIEFFDGQNWYPLNWANVSPDPGPHPKFGLQVYHANWGQYQHQRTMDNEPWNALNSLTYAFIGFGTSGTVSSLDYWGDQLELPLLFKRIKQNPSLQTTISFGGWTNAGQRMDVIFKKMMTDADARKKFVSGAVSAAMQAKVNGIDIDCEYPDTDDAENFVMLLEELRAELNVRMGKNAVLTIAGAAGNDKINVFSDTQWTRISNAVTQIGIMCYDYYGQWDPIADFHAAWKLDSNSPHQQQGSRYDVVSTLDLYRQKGIQPQQIMVGIPNYARAVIVPKAGNFAGLYQDVVGVPAGEYNEAGFYSWTSIFNLLNKQPSALDDLGVKEWFFYDSEHPYCKNAGMCLLSGSLPDGRWVTLNFLDQKAAEKRAELITQGSYKGAMLWANYCEPVDPKNMITQSISDGLSGKKQLQAQPAKLIDKDKAYGKTTIKTLVLEYVANLKGFFGSKKKAAILDDFYNNKDSDQMGRWLTHPEKGVKLATHRNLFKRFFSWLLPKGWIAEPKSYRLAKELYDTRNLFSVEHAPTRIISGKLHQQTIHVENSYQRILGETGCGEKNVPAQEATAQHFAGVVDLYKRPLGVNPEVANDAEPGATSDLIPSAPAP